SLSGRLRNILGPSTGEASPDSPNVPGAPARKRWVLDVRVSTFPTISGEVAVLRILNRVGALIPLSDLGMEEDALAKVRELAARPYGVTLLTGPTGSGKTTTMYSILQELITPDKNIITLEDPVEFRFDWIRQTEIKPARGLTYATAMRSILRQDPDIIMVGEIRDPETAEYAIRVALTGRLVFSTIHSNTTIGTIPRLLDMGIDAGPIAYALNGVIAQRLVRKICMQCRVPYEPDKRHLHYFGINFGFNQTGREFFKGAGCAKCNGSGYSGRIGIFEVLAIDETLRSLIIGKASIEDIKKYTRDTGMKTLQDDAVGKVLKGITTIEEVMRIV
ncbi:GspE/PulE family protein, partial [bacterium]|nr:GspE/PulE family protein [bacterium]